LLIDILNIVGTIAFATTGALCGIRKGLDTFGIIVLAVVTACGGGIFRDILLGSLPPAALLDPRDPLLAVLSAIFVFFLHKYLDRFHNVIVFFDALGLGAFTAIGVSIGIAAGGGAFLSILLGLSTGTVGGIIRDIFTREIPYVFQKEIYASASLLGGIWFVLLAPYSHSVALYGCFLVATGMRLLSFKYDLHLPRAKGLTEE